MILIGNLGRDPEIRNLEGGAKVANFPLATTETYKNRNGDRTEHTEWHNIVLWRGLADVAERFLKKGNSIYIEGRLRTRSWDDQATGAKRYITEVIADNMTMLGGRREDASEISNERKEEDTPPPDPADMNEEVSDDLPF